MIIQVQFPEGTEPNRAYYLVKDALLSYQDQRRYPNIETGGPLRVLLDEQIALAQVAEVVQR